MVSCDLTCIGLPNTTRAWRLNDSLLTGPAILNQLSERLTEYFRHNDTEKISHTSLWAAHKSVMRSHFREIATTRKRQKLHEIRMLTLDLERL